jgi:hypothetical protein
MKRAIVLLAFIGLVGCPPAQHPRHTLRASVLTVARAVKELDVLCAESARITRRVDVADTCAKSYNVARDSLLSAEAMIDAWTSADQRQVGCFAAKGGRALLEMARAARSAGAELPNSVVDGMQLAEILVPMAEGACPK